MAQYAKTAYNGCIWQHLFAMLRCFVIIFIFRFIICPARFVNNQLIYLLPVGSFNRFHSYDPPKQSGLEISFGEINVLQ